MALSVQPSGETMNSAKGGKKNETVDHDSNRPSYDCQRGFGYGAAESLPGPVKCSDLNVLTLNVLFSEYPQRSQRLTDIADFIASMTSSSLHCRS